MGRAVGAVGIRGEKHQLRALRNSQRLPFIFKRATPLFSSLLAPRSSLLFFHHVRSETSRDLSESGDAAGLLDRTHAPRVHVALSDDGSSGLRRYSCALCSE